MDGHTTRFGSAWDPLEQAAALLRARAARHGVELAGFDPLSAAAAVVGVETWMFALSATTLENPSRHGLSAVAALAGCYALLTGCEVVYEPGSAARTPDPSLFTLAEELTGRIQVWGLDPSEVFPLAAGVLSLGDDDPRLAAAADVLDTAARTQH